MLQSVGSIFVVRWTGSFPLGLDGKIGVHLCVFFCVCVCVCVCVLIYTSMEFPALIEDPIELLVFDQTQMDHSPSTLFTVHSYKLLTQQAV